MDALRCPDDDKKIAVLSGGERRRVALCRLLLQQPGVLLLDEPTNHLDAESIDWLEQHLQQYPGTVIAVTHDRYFLDHVAGWILENRPWRRDTLEGQLQAPGSTRRQNVWLRRRNRQANGARLSKESTNGCVWLPRLVRQRGRHVCQATTDSSTRTRRRGRRNWRSSSPMVRVSATR